MRVKDVANMYQDLLKIAKYHGVDYEDAQDIVQDLFVKLTEIENKEGSLDRLTYKGKINTVYLFNAIRNITINKRKYSDRNLQIEKDSVIPEFTIQTTEIKEHLKTLDPFCQKLYAAYMQDNISMRELSRKTNISVTTIFYGVKNIRETLKEIFYDKS